MHVSPVSAKRLRIAQPTPAYARFKNELQFRESAGDVQSLIRCLGNLARVAGDLGEVNEALEFGRRALKTAEELGDVEQSARSLIGIAAVHQKCEELSDALGCYRRALELATSAGNKELEAAAVANIGTI